MRRFMRNKLLGIERQDDQTLVAHGVLDDDLYGLQVDLSVNINTMTILSIGGKWNRWTTPECPRAIPVLQEAVGLCIEGEGFSQDIQKTVNRKGCRHYANLVLECCDTLREAAVLLIYPEWVTVMTTSSSAIRSSSEISASSSRICVRRASP